AARALLMAPIANLFGRVSSRQATPSRSAKWLCAVANLRAVSPRGGSTSKSSTISKWIRPCVTLRPRRDADWPCWDGDARRWQPPGESRSGDRDHAADWSRYEVEVQGDLARRTGRQ